MRTFHRRALSVGLLACAHWLAPGAQASVIEDHVLVAGSPQSLSYFLPSDGYDSAYELLFGTGSWNYPRLTLAFDSATQGDGFAKMQALPTYLTYVQDFSVFMVNANDEISAASLASGTQQMLFDVKGYKNPRIAAPVAPATANGQDIYLGFAYSYWNAAIKGDSTAYGWAHLRYSHTGSMTLVDSAMTMNEAGIYALTTRTVSTVDEASTTSMGLLGLAGLLATRRRRRAA